MKSGVQINSVGKNRALCVRLCVRASVCMHVRRGHEFCGRLALSAGIFKAKQTDRQTGRQTDRQTSRHVVLPVAFEADLSPCFFFFFLFFCFVFLSLFYSIM